MRMTVPLDRLYTYIEDIATQVYNDRVIIYRFSPHGSKNLEDFTLLSELDFCDILTPMILCADQEPLDFDYYENYKAHIPGDAYCNLPVIWTGTEKINYKNLKSIGVSTFYHFMLMHSEQRSDDLQKYKDQEYIPVYYWSHALLARDWFRFAEHQPQRKNVLKKFLIYNRAWSGTREYRLKFVELLLAQSLVNYCQVTMNPIDPESNIHYSAHEFLNPTWQPFQSLDHYFSPTSAPSWSSADYDIKDYNSCDIEVVLETLFDDGRLHLTEKSLRPIAVGQPFILMATHGSLAYLRSYGFRTFSSVINESYDQIQDPRKRMQAVVDLMTEISAWSETERAEKMSQLMAIAEYNQHRFFSNEFFNHVVDELKNNLTRAFDQPLLSVENVKNTINITTQLIECKKQNESIGPPLDEFYQLLDKEKKILEDLLSGNKP